VEDSESGNGYILGDSAGYDDDASVYPSSTVDSVGAYRSGEPGGEDPATEFDALESPPTTEGEKCTRLTTVGGCEVVGGRSSSP